jgi:hypothetical protein
MAKSKYAKYVNPLRLWTETVRPFYRGKMADFSLLFDEQVYPDTSCWVETFYAYAPGTGVGIPGETPIIFDGKTYAPRKTWGQHAHPGFDELFLFFGTDPRDNTRLGGEVEAWLGEGQDAQKFIIKEPTAKWVPKDLAHNPWIVTRVDNPKYPIIIMVIALSSRYNVKHNDWRNLPHPPSFSIDKLGVEQPGKGLYTGYVKKIPFSSDRIFPWLRTRVATPTLMFDKNVIPDVPIWVEWFHVYAGGCGVGVPALDAPSAAKLPDGTLFDRSKGFSHGHNFDELFLFIPADPHDTLNLGGEVETWLGKGKDAEKFTLTGSSSVWCPANLHHNPQYYKRVDADKSYFMIVIALTKSYFGDKMSVAPLARPFEW